MHTCSNCGTEFDTKYLQCPNCGCTRGDIREAEKHDKRTERIGGIIAIFFVIFLIGLITYGGYLLMNPIKDGPITSSVTTTTTETTTTSDVSTTTTTVPTTQVVGTQLHLGGHTITIPEGFYQTEGYINFTPISLYNFWDNYVWFTNNTTTYFMAIIDKTTFKLTEDTRTTQGTKNVINGELLSQGFKEITVDRLSGRLCYFTTRPIDENNSTVLLFYNRNNYLIITSFNISGNEVNKNNTADIIQIIGSIK